MESELNVQKWDDDGSNRLALVFRGQTLLFGFSSKIN